MDLEQVLDTIIDNATIDGVSWPTTTVTAFQLIEAMGFDITPQRLNSLIDNSDLPKPAGNPPQLEWEYEDVLSYAEECHRRRWWIKNYTEFDHLRNANERRKAEDFRRRLGNLMEPFRRASWQTLLAMMAGEDDRAMRRAYRAAISMKLNGDQSQLEAMAEEDEL